MGKTIDVEHEEQRLRAARDIALICYNGSQAALFNFVTPEADVLARTDPAGFTQHAELWFGRWDAALRDFDAIVTADLWERIEFAARDLEPLAIAGFSFATGHQAARQSLQWWANRRIGWEAKHNAVELLDSKLRLGDAVKNNPWLNVSPSLGIDARIIKECSLAIADLKESSEIEVDDPTAYMPASKVNNGKFSPLSKLTKFMGKIPNEIIRRKPNGKRRLLIHVADWTRYWDEQDRVKLAALDIAEIGDTIAEVEARRETEKAGWSPETRERRRRK